MGGLQGVSDNFYSSGRSFVWKHSRQASVNVVGGAIGISTRNSV